jgi:type I restriction enzyme S subunit
MSIQLAPEHLAIAKEIFGDLGRDVFVFGSRAKGSAKPLSDLDLVIMIDIPRDQLIDLKMRFEESDLPMKVDLTLWNFLDESFRSHIKPDLKALSD